jgi:hypothetical protein
MEFFAKATELPFHGKQDSRCVMRSGKSQTATTEALLDTLSFSAE